MKLDEIINEVIDSQLSGNDLRKLNKVIIAEIKAARQRDDRKMTALLSPGDRVQVTGRLQGNALLNEKCTVQKINRTRVVVKPDNERYPTTVPASVLTKLENE